MKMLQTAGQSAGINPLENTNTRKKSQTISSWKLSISFRFRIYNGTWQLYFILLVLLTTQVPGVSMSLPVLPAYDWETSLVQCRLIFCSGMNCRVFEIRWIWRTKKITSLSRSNDPATQDQCWLSYSGSVISCSFVITSLKSIRCFSILHIYKFIWLTLLNSIQSLIFLPIPFHYLFLGNFALFCTKRASSLCVNSNSSFITKLFFSLTPHLATAHLVPPLLYFAYLWDGWAELFKVSMAPLPETLYLFTFCIRYYYLNTKPASWPAGLFQLWRVNCVLSNQPLALKNARLFELCPLKRLPFIFHAAPLNWPDRTGAYIHQREG